MQIIIDNAALQHKLDAAAARLTDATPLMQRLSMSLLDDTEQNFAAQGRPRWAGLSPRYAAKRRGGMILQKSGQLAGSITAFHDATSAAVGSNKVYAAIHHFGGVAGRGHKSKIPSRPYLPVDKNGNLQADAQANIEDVCDYYLSASFNP
jgi:phage virion morphogenesis protein